VKDTCAAPEPLQAPAGLRILIRGAGDLATGIAHRLIRSGLCPAMTEIPSPVAVRRPVCFSEAVYEGTWEVEGVRAQLVTDAGEIDGVRAVAEVPVLVDPDLHCLSSWSPQVLVDATLAKRNLGLRRDLAPLVIGVGPGFTAGVDVDRVVETNRGHNLGRVYDTGSAEPNTGVPGDTAGFTVERVLRAPCDGRFVTAVEIGSLVNAGEVLARVGSAEVRARISGIVRGLLRSGTPVSEGLKVGDIDPRGMREYCYTISEKARAVAGGVLEAVLAGAPRRGEGE
jgi:xanthine dehydrogenase accessory factor